MGVRIFREPLYTCVLQRKLHIIPTERHNAGKLGRGQKIQMPPEIFVNWWVQR